MIVTCNQRTRVDHALSPSLLKISPHHARWRGDHRRRQGRMGLKASLQAADFIGGVKGRPWRAARARVSSGLLHSSSRVCTAVA